MQVRRKVLACALGLAGLMALPTLAKEMSSAMHSYQVTGPVLEVTDSAITVQKGKDKWEIQRTKDTEVKGDVKVGSKVTIHYHMVADDVEVKGTSKKPS